MIFSSVSISFNLIFNRIFRDFSKSVTIIFGYQISHMAQIPVKAALYMSKLFKTSEPMQTYLFYILLKSWNIDPPNAITDSDDNMSLGQH